jgi:hypothetical protein
VADAAKSQQPANCSDKIRSQPSFHRCSDRSSDGFRETFCSVLIYHIWWLENGMPVAIALIFGTALLAVVLVVQLIWALLILIPLYVYFALAIFLVLRSRRRQAEADASVAREAERQRLLNEQEFRAWKAAADGARRNADKRNRALRQFDENRNPPEN